MQHAAGVAQARDRGAVQQVGVDARHLRGHVRTQAQHAARQLVHQLEGAQVGVFTGAGQQRFQVLQQRRHHQLVAVQAEIIQHQTTQFFNLACFRRQNVGDILGQQPIWHGSIN
jgi:hypothetical protein